MSQLIAWAATTGAITIATWIGIVQYGRLQRRRIAAAQARQHELEISRRQLAELESRIDFADRLLDEKTKRPEERR